MAPDPDRSLSADLGLRPWTVPGQTVQRPAIGQGEPPLIDDGAVLFLQLHKNGVFPVRPAIAAQTQLFLVDGLFQAPADEPEIRSVQIEIADRAVAVFVGTQTSSGGGEQPGLLPPCQQIFEFIALKDSLFFHGEILLVLGW